MRCPGCKARVPIRPACPRCDGPLGGKPVPLTSEQKEALRKELLWLTVFYLSASAFLGMMAVDRADHQKDSWVLIFFSLLFFGYGSLQLLRLFRDLHSGIALTRVDLLEKILPPGRANNDYHGRFAELGNLRLPPEIEIGVPKGHHYRLLYSPASRIIWTLESTEEGDA